jgi:hypothetical protein
MRAGRHRAVGLALVLVDVDQVDVRRHVQLARAELAHADDPELDAPALRVARHAVAFFRLGLRLRQRQLQRGLGQRRHAVGHGGQRRRLLHVQAGQSFQAQLPRHAQRRRQCAATVAQCLHQGAHPRGIEGPRRQQ